MAPAVVFVCARNAVRSPMAQALWRIQFGDDVSVMSCGVEPASWPDGFMITVMAEKGIDLSGFECRDMETAADDVVELVVCLADDVDDHAAGFAERRGAEHQLWPMPDPSAVTGSREVRLDAYRAVRDAIQARIAQYARETA